MSTPAAINKLFGSQPPRCKSMIVTVMGDVVAVHGGATDTGALIAINQLFDISKPSTRIGLRRLTQEGWLQQRSAADIRRSGVHQFSEKGQRLFCQSAPLIYGNNAPALPAQWQLVLLDTNIRLRQVRRFIKALGWLGFGKVEPAVYACPHAARDDVAHLIEQYDLVGKVWLLQGAVPCEDAELHRLAHRLWDIKSLQREYRAFMRCICAAQRRQEKGLSDEAAACLRLRLVHDYRRLILRTPPLPHDMREKFFCFDEVFALCGELYHNLAAASMGFFNQISGDFTSATLDASFAQRFCPTACQGFSPVWMEATTSAQKENWRLLRVGRG